MGKLRRGLIACWLGLAALGLACADKSTADDGNGMGTATGGTVSGARASGGASGGSGPMTAPSGGAGGPSSGNGGDSGAATGGSGGDGGAAGNGDGSTAVTDAAATPDLPIGTADTAASGDAGGTSDGFRPIIPDAAPWQMMCPESASRTDCCTLYCTCMMKFCPVTIPQACVQACVTAKNWDLVCRTYQCFASQNPNFPQDHDSHCRHAIGLQGKCGNK